MATEFGVGLYSPKVAARIARVKPQQFQAWARGNLVHGERFKFGKKTERVYSYNDLLLIRLIVRLRDKGLRYQKINKALDTIRLMSGGDPKAWLKATIYVDANLIVALLADRHEWNPMAVSQGPHKMAVVFFPELVKELETELVPPARFPHVEVNPEVLGGAPVVKGTRIPTRAIALVKESGEDPRVAYPSLTKDQVEEAVAYERFLQAA